jgi:hypothetical protein
MMYQVRRVETAYCTIAVSMTPHSSCTHNTHQRSSGGGHTQRRTHNSPVNFMNYRSYQESCGYYCHRRYLINAIPKYRTLQYDNMRCMASYKIVLQTTTFDLTDLCTHSCFPFHVKSECHPGSYLPLFQRTNTLPVQIEQHVGGFIAL